MFMVFDLLGHCWWKT